MNTYTIVTTEGLVVVRHAKTLSEAVKTIEDEGYKPSVVKVN